MKSAILFLVLCAQPVFARATVEAPASITQQRYSLEMHKIQQRQAFVKACYDLGRTTETCERALGGRKLADSIFDLQGPGAQTQGLNSMRIRDIREIRPLLQQCMDSGSG